MRIAILGSVALPVPPPFQGGTEWIAYYQAQGLAKRGHEVTLFAAKGSKSDGFTLIEAGGGDTVAGSNLEKKVEGTFTEGSRKLRLENIYLSQVVQHLLNRKDEYDVILNNMRGEAVFLPIAKLLGKPFVNVMHLPMFDKLAATFKSYNTHVISISNAQRTGFEDLNYLATVYNCVDTNRYAFNPTPSDYILMMGSIAPHKNQAAAIRIAKRAGVKLVLAGKIGDQKYFDSIKGDIDGENVKWIGELGFEEKLTLYQMAKAFIFPINWPEPFGLVMIEAMSCGVPVVAFGNGAIPEVVSHGKTGYIIQNNNEDEAVEAVKKIESIKREDCRVWVEEKFTIDTMVADYENALKKV